MSDDRLADAHPATTNEVKAAAWDEGYLDAQDDTPHKSPNPYRDGELRK